MKPKHRGHCLPPIDLRDALCALRRPCHATVSAVTWEPLAMLLRFTGMRINEVAMLDASSLQTVEGVRCLRIARRYGARLIPLHPRVDAGLALLQRHRPNGLWFPDLNVHCMTSASAFWGQNYRYFWHPLARRLWEPMTVIAWRHCYYGHLFHDPALMALVFEKMSKGTMLQRYDGAPLPVLRDAIMRIP